MADYFYSLEIIVMKSRYLGWEFGVPENWRGNCPCFMCNIGDEENQ